MCLAGYGRVHHLTQGSPKNALAVENNDSTGEQRGPIVRTVAAYGVVGPAATAPVLARVSGVIQALYCDANMKVKAGQLCAKIDPRPYQIVVDQSKADLQASEARLEKDKATLALMKAALEHQEARAKRRVISRKALDKSRKSFETVKAENARDEAKAAEHAEALHAAETSLGSTDIVSPLDGTVLSRNVESGQTIAMLPAGTLVRVDGDAGEVTVHA